MRFERQRTNSRIFACRIHELLHDVVSTTRSAATFAVGMVRAGIAVTLIFFIIQLGISDLYAQQAPPPTGPTYTQLSYEQLHQLVAPIALYPDALVAQVLAASTYPTQVSDADRFVQQNASMSHQELARIVDTQPWDPSVKALTAFPSVLSNLDHNLDWTSKLGNAYFNQPQDVMAAVQTMRQRAYAAGTLRSSPQENVVYQQGYLVIQPVNPAVVYVPVYNPWVVYGAPVPVYPTYVAPPPPSAGTVVAAAAVGFAAGIAIGAYSSYHWSCSYWSPNWYSHTVIYNNAPYVSGSLTVVNHGYYGYYDHAPSARAYNHEVVYGPNGYASRTATTVGNQTNVHITGPNGTASRSTTHNGNGNYASTVTGPNGQTVNHTVTGRGTGDVTATTSGPNGTMSRSTTFNGNGTSSTTVTGPNSQTADRTAAGRSNGNVKATTARPNGTVDRSNPNSGNGRSSALTSPMGNANRALKSTGSGRSRIWMPRK